ncbi:hypothetical protein [Micromonospora sp. NBRC 101691]|uniref:hypothetical protein n=1 Tax=Micromonospora sp. NBRC 101691 TaxID=3032198 RepID=UPI0024A020C0|nr:hypothetical protein [Micromonospora sp. NBRC 101691]GLY24143.1 hypothetical protein Misp04_38750 [Micromonospora sp. NBRC 101691]
MSEGTARPDGRRTSPTERLAEDVADVVREEVRAVRAQVGRAARPAGAPPAGNHVAQPGRGGVTGTPVDG